MSHFMKAHFDTEGPFGLPMSDAQAKSLEERLKSLPKDKEVQIGVLDIRTSMIETPEQVADRIRKVLKVVPPERVYLSTDCGMKPLPRMVAKLKLKALADGAKIVRKELAG